MTNITNEQLEAWAGLGPWLKQYSPTIDAMQIIEPVERDLEGNVPITRKIAYVYEGQRMDMERIKLHSDALAAAPALARLVLAKDAEIARLKTQIQDIKECWDWWQEDTYDRCSSVVDDAIRQAMKEKTSDDGN